MTNTIMTVSEWYEEMWNEKLHANEFDSKSAESLAIIYSEYILSEHRKAAKYYFEGKVYTEEELRTCGLTMSESNAPILIKEGIILPEGLTDERIPEPVRRLHKEFIDEVKLLNEIQ